MSRAVVAFLLVTAIAAACTTAGPPPAPSRYAQLYRTATAPLHPELLLCPGASAYNTGPVGSRGEVLAYTPYIETLAGPLLRNPTDGACLSSGYGFRPRAGADRGHYGIDLANRDGGLVYAAGAGRVDAINRRAGYGISIEIDHGQGVRTIYGHLAELNPALRIGARVAQGAPMGFMGATGDATGVHLHYELLVGPTRVSPLS